MRVAFAQTRTISLQSFKEAYAAGAIGGTPAAGGVPIPVVSPIGIPIGGTTGAAGAAVGSTGIPVPGTTGAAGCCPVGSIGSVGFMFISPPFFVTLKYSIQSLKSIPCTEPLTLYIII